MSPDEQDTLLSSLDSFLDQNVISEVLECVRGGKEATVFRCRSGMRNGPPFFAAKVYRPSSRRSFRNDGAYRNGRVITNPRVRRAVESKSDFGREVQQHLWVAAEFETQQRLYDAGVSVPRPMRCNGGAILMEWIGDESAAAPQLRHANLSATEAVAAFRLLMRDVETML